MSEKILETRICRHCGTSFDITDVDADFLTRLAPTIGGKTIELPFPTHCPLCRKIRRNAWRNEKNIYKRKCDVTGKDIISLFSPDSLCPVYESDYWYSDKWDAHQYGKSFDFSRSFFEQWHELSKHVPAPGKIISPTMENSDYSDNCGNLKDCYLVFNAAQCDNCYYSNDIYNSTYCVDSIGLFGCEESYELANAYKCYQLYYSYDARNCRFSEFLYSCEGCEYCYSCADLKNQKYTIFNQQYSKEEYFEKIKILKSEKIDQQKNNFLEFLQSIGYEMKLPENRGSEGIYESDEIHNSRNIWKSRTIHDSEDIRYCRGLMDTRLAMDIDNWGDRLEKSYEAMVAGEAASNVYFSPLVWGNISHIFYSLFCINNVHNCFGCVGLRNASYCILNKQYSKEEYEALVPQIIQKMIADSEWGEFFPAKYSHFGYNQTLNMVKYPLTKEEALNNGFAWSDYESPFPKIDKAIPAAKLPENISQIPDDILNWAIECEVSGKPFRVTRPELEFYRKHNLPIPRKHPDERYKERTLIYMNY